MKQNPLVDRLLSDEKVRDIDYPALASALPDADYMFDGQSPQGRGRTWMHANGDRFTVRDLGPGQPLWGQEIDKVARRLKATHGPGGASGDRQGPKGTP